jgi:hypothetical protein
VANTGEIKFAQELTDGCLKFLEELCDVELYTYQKEIADRIFFSLIIGDAEEITVESARQIGKSEVLADVAATAMIIFPKLAKMYPDHPVLRKFRTGLWVGCFGPTQLQSETIFSRIELRLTSARAKEILGDPEIDDRTMVGGKLIRLTGTNSFCRQQTAHPKAKIESKSYHLVLVDEAQDADSATVRKSVHPMLTATGGTICKIGTPSAHKSDFYEAIGRNRNRKSGSGKCNHFSVDYKRAAKENPFYEQAIEREKERLGEGSDEFQMSYNLRWLLDRGMFITDEQIDALGDTTMQAVQTWTNTPIVVGLDVAQKHDSTVLTALWVDWDRPDEFGLYDHRILNWKEIHGENWESQYRQICDFVSRYYVMRLAVDAQGMGGPVAERLQVLLPNVDVVPCAMNPVDQSARWQHLMQLIQRGLIGWPAHERTRRTQMYKRFTQQLAEVEKEYKGRYLTVGAPKNERNAHDDYIDSLALACSLTKDFGEAAHVEVWNTNPFFDRHSRRESVRV